MDEWVEECFARKEARSINSMDRKNDVDDGNSLAGQLPVLAMGQGERMEQGGGERRSKKPVEIGRSKQSNVNGGINE